MFPLWLPLIFVRFYSKLSEGFIAKAKFYINVSTSSIASKQLVQVIYTMAIFIRHGVVIRTFFISISPWGKMFFFAWQPIQGERPSNYGGQDHEGRPKWGRRGKSHNLFMRSNRKSWWWQQLDDPPPGGGIYYATQFVRQVRTPRRLPIWWWRIQSSEWCDGRWPNLPGKSTTKNMTMKMTKKWQRPP